MTPISIACLSFSLPKSNAENLPKKIIIQNFASKESNKLYYYSKVFSGNFSIIKDYEEKDYENAIGFFRVGNDQVRITSTSGTPVISIGII